MGGKGGKRTRKRERTGSTEGEKKQEKGFFSCALSRPHAPLPPIVSLFLSPRSLFPLALHGGGGNEKHTHRSPKFFITKRKRKKKHTRQELLLSLSLSSLRNSSFFSVFFSLFCFLSKLQGQRRGRGHRRHAPVRRSAVLVPHGRQGPVLGPAEGAVEERYRPQQLRRARKRRRGRRRGRGKRR